MQSCEQCDRGTGAEHSGTTFCGFPYFGSWSPLLVFRREGAQDDETSSNLSTWARACHEMVALV